MFQKLFSKNPFGALQQRGSTHLPKKTVQMMTQVRGMFFTQVTYTLFAYLLYFGSRYISGLAYWKPYAPFILFFVTLMVAVQVIIFIVDLAVDYSIREHKVRNESRTWIQISDDHAYKRNIERILASAGHRPFNSPNRPPPQQPPRQPERAPRQPQPPQQPRRDPQPARVAPRAAEAMPHIEPPTPRQEDPELPAGARRGGAPPMPLE